jgi:hypothetical protein
MHLRATDGANAAVDWADVKSLWETPGWIYALFHFPTGRLYVGQTRRRVWKRAQEHWWSRGRSKDLLHDALANDTNPFAFVMVPIEKLPPPECFPRAEREALLRRDALNRERKWVGKLNSMWPRGFNASYPGYPVSRKVLRKGQPGPARDVEPSAQGDPPPIPQFKEWVERCQKGDSGALAEAREWGKPRLCAALDWLQAHIPGDNRRIGHLSLEVKLIDLIRAKRKEAPERHFLKFCYSNNGARFLELRKVLRDEEVYKLHPHPEVAAAIMVSDKFAPQWQAWICNYATVADELDLEAARADSLEGCTCRKALRRSEPEAFHDGHVVSNDSELLRWPFLQTLASKGKKFRLEGPPDSVLRDLKTSLGQYVDWAARAAASDLNRRRKLEEWAEAVEAKCYANWQAKASKEELVPQGFAGLTKQIREAQRDLVFVHDDRAPHGLVFVCKRWYQRQMAAYLADSSVFEEVPASWEEVVERLAEFNRKWGFPTGAGVVYNYGIWKPSKGKFRYIAGTRKCRDPPAEAAAPETDSRRPKGPPRQPLYHLNKALVKFLKVVRGHSGRRMRSGSAPKASRPSGGSTAWRRSCARSGRTPRRSSQGAWRRRTSRPCTPPSPSTPSSNGPWSPPGRPGPLSRPPRSPWGSIPPRSPP